jgi:pimeloyl-ACP methyl ester carboxylesterase
VVLAAGLACVTAVGSAIIAARYPPSGRIVDAGGLDLHVVEAGPLDDPRPPVLVIHGASGNLEEIRLALGDALRDRRTIFVDRPGHGHSERGDDAMAAPAAQAGVLADLLDRLGTGPAVVVGHSWGAAVAAAMAVTRPEAVSGLVLVAPATHPWPGGVAWYHDIVRRPVLGHLFAWTVPLPAGLALLRPGARGVFAPDVMPDDYIDGGAVATTLRPATFRANSIDIWTLKANLAAMAPRYREITAPTVVITGDADGVVWPSIHAEPLAREIAGAELVVLAGVGHMPHFARPDVVSAAVGTVTRRALADVTASAAAGRDRVSEIRSRSDRRPR